MTWRTVLVGTATAVALSLAAWSVHAQTQGQTSIPIPRPFPQPGQPTTQPPPSTTPSSPNPPASTGSTTSTTSKTPSKPAEPAAPPATLPSTANVRPTDRELGVTVYPAAEFIDSYDAGRGQRIYLFGTNASYADIVAYFKTTLRDSGRELFKAPAMQQFDLGRFRDDTMAYPPSVVVKDYTWSIDGQAAPGYLVVDGARDKRFKTVIQIVPATGK
jgi:hypothetical protein